MEMRIVPQFTVTVGYEDEGNSVRRRREKWQTAFNYISNVEVTSQHFKTALKI